MINEFREKIIIFVLEAYERARFSFIDFGLADFCHGEF